MADGFLNFALLHRLHGCTAKKSEAQSKDLEQEVRQSTLN